MEASMAKQVSRKIVLHFSKQTWDKPIVYRLAKDFDLSFNILKAHVLPHQESYMVMELSGPADEYRKGVKYLEKCGLKVKPVDREIQRDEQRCYHCGVCTAVCYTHALTVHPRTKEITFDGRLCSGCGLCMPICPSRAMQIAL
jgi:ferredoxin